MPNIATESPDKIVYNQPNSWIWIITFPPYLAVVVVALGGLYAVVRGIIVRPDFVVFVIAITDFFIFALVLKWAKHFTRTRCIVDKVLGQVTVAWRLAFLPIFRSSASLSCYQSLYLHGRITRLTSPFGSELSSEVDYYLELTGSGIRHITICHSASKEPLVEIALGIAKFANLNFFDGTFDPPEAILLTEKAFSEVFERASEVMHEQDVFQRRCAAMDLTNRES